MVVGVFPLHLFALRDPQREFCFSLFFAGRAFALGQSPNTTPGPPSLFEKKGEEFTRSAVAVEGTRAFENKGEPKEELFRRDRSSWQKRTVGEYLESSK